MLGILPTIRKSILSPIVMVKQVWNHDYQDFKLILEQTEELHYFYVSANTQKFLARSLIITIISLLSLIAGLAGYSTVSILRYNVMEASKIEADKKRQEALSAIAALSENTFVSEDGISQEELINVARDYRLRMEKMQVLIDFSSQELKLASHALEEGLRASGLNPNLISRIKSKVASAKTGIGGNSDEIKLSNVSQQVMENYKNNLMQLEQVKRVYQSFPTKTPATHAVTTSKFGVRIHPISKKLTLHEGLDYVPGVDQNARAVIPGVVEKVNYSTTGYGNMVVLLHPNKIRTIYAHLDSIQVKEGQRIAEDQVLGKIGNTGFSTGTHLHYEISMDNVKINPSLITAIAKNVQ